MSSGINVWLSDSILTSPALTWQVKDHQAAGGIMITTSHNPPGYDGLKFKAAYGGSALPEIVADIEKYICNLENNRQSFSKFEKVFQYDYFTPKHEYLAHIKKLLDYNTLAGLKDVVIKAVISNKAVLGLETDGDGDRIGAIDQDGRFINSHQIMALLIKYLVEKCGCSGDVAKTLTVSELVRRVANKYGLKLHETIVRFKYIANLMLTADILIGGEESGGIGSATRF